MRDIASIKVSVGRASVLWMAGRLVRVSSASAEPASAPVRMFSQRLEQVAGTGVAAPALRR